MCLKNFISRLITLIVVGSVQLLAEARLGSSEGVTEITDLGFYLTSGLNEFLGKHENISYILSGINSIYSLAFTFYFIFFRPLFLGDIPCGTVMALSTLSRTICGSFTTLPIHPMAQLNDNEIPNMVTGNKFFMFFSGHTCNSEVGRMILKHEGWTGFARLLRLLNLLQAIRLVATRGHYTIDVISGYAFSFLLYDIYVWSKKRMDEKSQITVGKFPEGGKKD